MNIRNLSDDCLAKLYLRLREKQYNYKGFRPFSINKIQSKVSLEEHRRLKERFGWN